MPFVFCDITIRVMVTYALYTSSKMCFQNVHYNGFFHLQFFVCIKMSQKVSTLEHCRYLSLWNKCQPLFQSWWGGEISHQNFHIPPIMLRYLIKCSLNSKFPSPNYWILLHILVIKTLKIHTLCGNGDIFMSMCLCMYPPLRLFITSGIMWCDHMVG